MPKYRITIDGATYEVSSSTPLTDVEAYGHAKTQHEASGGTFSPAPATENPPGVTGQVDPSETSDPKEAYWNSLKDTAGKTVSGIASSLNPVNMAKGLYNLGDAMVPTAEHQPARDALWQGAKDTASGLAHGDPEVGGQMIGNLASGLILPRVPGAISATGRGIQAAGDVMGHGPGALAVRSFAGHAIGGTPGAIGAAVAPSVLRGFGRVVEGAGEGMASIGDRIMGRNLTPEFPPRIQVADLGNVPDVRDLGNPNAPAPQPAPRQLNAAPSGPFPSPPSSMGPARGFLADAPPQPSPPSSAAPRGMLGPATPPVPPPSLASDQQAAMLDAVHGPARLGSLPASQSPRVLSWKPGFGPSAGDAATLRQAYGSKTAGTLLKARGDQIKTLAPTDGPSQLPAQVSDSLGQQFLAASPEVRQQMLSTASPLVRALFQSLAERSP